MYITNPKFDITKYDLITDRNNIRKLLSFINPNLTKANRKRAFTIIAETVSGGCCTIFRRVEPFTTEVVGNQNQNSDLNSNGNENVNANKELKAARTTATSTATGIGTDVNIVKGGYGHSFEKAYTTDRVVDSTGHHRIISYQFGGLNMVVRFETDGCVANNSTITSTVTDDDDFDGNNNQKPPHGQQPQSQSSQTARLSTEPTLEIKTRVIRRRIPLPEVLPQLWLSQTHKLVRAYHLSGRFEFPQVEDITAECKEWEDAHQQDLRRLVYLIRQIMDVVKDGGGRAVIEYDDRVSDELVIWKQTGTRRLLPDDIYDEFERSTAARRRREGEMSRRRSNE